MAQHLDRQVQSVGVQSPGPSQGDEIVPRHGYLVAHGMVTESWDG